MSEALKSCPNLACRSSEVKQRAQTNPGVVCTKCYVSAPTVAIWNSLPRLTPQEVGAAIELEAQRRNRNGLAPNVTVAQSATVADLAAGRWEPGGTP